MPSAAGHLSTTGRQPGLRTLTRASLAGIHITAPTTDQSVASLIGATRNSLLRKVFAAAIYAQASGSAGGMRGVPNPCYGYTSPPLLGAPGLPGAYSYIQNVPVNFGVITVTLGQPGQFVNYLATSINQDQGANLGGGSGAKRDNNLSYAGGSGGGRAGSTVIKGLTGGDWIVPSSGAGGGGGATIKRANGTPGNFGFLGSVPAVSAGLVTEGRSGAGGPMSGSCYGGANGFGGFYPLAFTAVTTNPNPTYVMPSATLTDLGLTHQPGDANLFTAPPTPVNSPWGAVTTSSPGAGGKGHYGIQYTPLLSESGLVGRVTIMPKIKF